MNNLVLHPTTSDQLHQFTVRPSHAVLVLGPEGIGKGTITHDLAASLLDRTAESLETYPYLKIVTPDKQSISIESVRDLQQFAKLKVPSEGKSISRIAIIEQAELLTIEAQNALLKLLEEPPIDTVLILAAANDQSLLPTIRSRVQIITIQEPQADEIKKYFSDLDFDAAKIQQAYLMSGGLPGLMQALLSENEEHPLVQATQQARKILQASPFERLTMVDALSKQRTEVMRLLFILQQMASAALQATAKKGDNEAALKRWQHILTEVYEAEAMLTSQAQVKLVLTNLLLNI